MKKSVNFCRKEEAIHDFAVKFFDEIFLAENGRIAVDARDSFSKAVIVDTAHKVCHEVVSDFKINAGEDELEKIKNTRAIMTSA